MLAIASMSVMTPPGIGDRLDEDRLGLRRDRALERGDVVGIGPHHVPAEILERVIELVDRAAVELARGDELVAGRHQAVEHQHLRGVAGGDREPRGAAFERGDALLQHRVGRIADAGVDVAEGLQAEQRGGVIDVVEHERRGLIDRRRARAGGRIGLRAGVDRERGKAGSAFGHGAVLAWPRQAGSAEVYRTHRGASRQRAAVALIRNRRPSIRAAISQKSVLPECAPERDRSRRRRYELRRDALGRRGRLLNSASSPCGRPARCG